MSQHEIQENMNGALYTDGACSGNPGPGGWAFLLQHHDHEVQKFGAVEHTTNNRMELMAVIQGLNHYRTDCLSGALQVFSDSQYVIKGITQWIFQWQANGWRTSQKKPVENQDLWEALWEHSQNLSHVSWHWVRGHSGHPENERVDHLAQQAIILGAKASNNLESSNVL